MYGSVRRVLDIVESYLGDRIEWQFGQHFRRLEIIPLIDWDNAQSGFGFIESGRSLAEDGTMLPYGLNFDVIAHEIGHSILFSLMGLPESGQISAEFRAFHESAADVTALIAVMHFDTVLDRLLRSCRGNIYVLNELNRLGEVADAKQIRVASNGDRMSDVGSEPHDLSRPLTGACFDVIAYIYACELADRGLVRRELWARAYETNVAGQQSEHVAEEFARSYANRHFAFKAALESARDLFGRYLVSAWQALSPDRLTFGDVAGGLLDADRRISGSRYQEEIREIFQWRRIGIPVRPLLI
jgi:hypothetical protein